MKKHAAIVTVVLLSAAMPGLAREYHVGANGNDSQEGSADKPLRTISAAAERAQPGDTITVHAGVYRERITPPRGGESDAQRITYQAAPGEKVVIKGSELITGWQRVQNDTWKVSIPNSFFGKFNPYANAIHGDWFVPLGREHHTGAVYLDGKWLVEAAKLEQVMAPVRETPLWFGAGGGTLLNVAWMQPLNADANTARMPAADFVAQQGVQKAPCSEGGECIGWIEHGDWVRYDHVDFGSRTEQLEIRAASETSGGIIEIRADKPDGELLGTCKVPNTGGWQKWVSYKPRIKPVSGKKSICLTFKNAQAASSDGESWPVQELAMWFAQVDAVNTTIFAQFKDIDPNQAEVEINVRQTVFYPAKTGVNYLTVRRFTMMHAATPWAPPTAEQIGLIGTNWSKGWIIENNDVSYSTCVGIALGKHGDAFDNTSQNSAEGYVETIKRGLARGWSKENIGHHIVRDNRVSHCEQAGIVGSLGPIFCTVTGNDIHDIHVRRLFTGAEMAGIKFHGAIDTEISHNHIYRTCRGIWLDWMAQGTHVTGNLFHDNGPWEDLMVEVDHGPFLVDNNVFLSSVCLFDMSQGGAYVHNLYAGRLGLHPELGRETPYHKAHSTEMVGLARIPGGDSRFYNNVFVGPAGLNSYDQATLPMYLAGNVFLKGAVPCRSEASPLVRADFDPAMQLTTENGSTRLRMTFDKAWAESPRPLVTTALLGKAKIPDLPFEHTDGSPYRIDTDYFGKPRDSANPFPGPFELSSGGEQLLQVWPTPAR